MSDKIDRAAIPLPTGQYFEFLGAVREMMRERLAKGEALSCPCCGGTVKVYRRGIYAKMVSALATLAKRQCGLSPSELAAITAGGDAHKLATFGLIEQDSETGAWGITTRGARWLSGKISISSAVYLFQGKVLGFDNEKLVHVNDVRNLGVDISEILSAWGETERQAAE